MQTQAVQQLNILTLEVTTACDLACTNCFALADLPHKSGMRLEDARAVTREGRELGFRVLHLTGGEPTLWRHWLDLLEYGLSLGYEHVKFNTHGGTLTPETCERLRAFGDKLSLSISLNGRAEIHERVRGAGSHARAHRGIRTALDHDLAVEVFTTVGQELLPGLTGFAEELFTEYPALFRLVLIQNHRVSNDYYQFKEDLLGPEDFIRLVENAALLSLAGYPIHFLDNALANVVAARKSMPFLPRSPDIRRFDHLTVLANKEMTPYHSCRESFGTYETGRMKAVVGSSEHENRVAPEERLCGDCPYYSGCRSNGMNRPSDTTLDYEEELYCRRVNRLLDASEA